ncbi:MAG: hypothetical protein HC796_02470 [Synechococcaceae cyanobacterium RL_1_2]|nr:hypothetical protein [Synechococcaceae cyanobacterium RL_1_2]
MALGEPLDTVIELPPIKELAHHYIEQMKSLQPEGPYYLMGLSFGGIVAYEMAQQLLAQGQQVGILALFDSHIIPDYLSPRPWPQRIKILGQLGFKELWQRLLSKLERWNSQQMVKQLTTDQTSNLAYSPHIHNAEVNCQLIDQYQPQSYPEEVILFQAQDDIYVNHITRLAATEWPAYAKKLKVYEISGNHTGILVEPNVQHLAAYLKVEIDQTLAAQTQQENSTEFITQRS